MKQQCITADTIRVSVGRVRGTSQSSECGGWILIPFHAFTFMTGLGPVRLVLCLSNPSLACPMRVDLYLFPPRGLRDSGVLHTELG